VLVFIDGNDLRAAELARIAPGFEVVVEGLQTGFSTSSTRMSRTRPPRSERRGGGRDRRDPASSSRRAGSTTPTAPVAPCVRTPTRSRADNETVTR